MDENTDERVYISIHKSIRGVRVALAEAERMSIVATEEWQPPELRVLEATEVMVGIITIPPAYLLKGRRWTESGQPIEGRQRKTMFIEQTDIFFRRKHELTRQS
jgi:hypothetical protein